MKRKVSVTIDQKIYQKAHELGINVSKVSENALLAIIDAVEQANGANTVFSRGFSAEKSRLVRSPGFEPGSSAWQAMDWSAFQQWLEAKNYRGSWKYSLFGCAKKYGKLLFDGDLGKLSGLSGSQKSNALKALSALSKFLGCYESFKQMRRDYGLTWGGKSPSDLMIDRLNKVENSDEIWSWIKQAKTVREDLTEFLDLSAVSGMRLVELVESYNLIIDLARKKQLTTYFNRDNLVLEHFRFKERFIRRNKKVFVTFISAEIVDAIGESSKVSSPHAVSASFRRNGFNSRFGDVREAHGTFMTKYLKASEIDFLHGRCATSTFMKHYFNPALISDLRERAFKGITEIQEKIKL